MRLMKVKLDFHSIFDMAQLVGPLNPVVVSIYRQKRGEKKQSADKTPDVLSTVSVLHSSSTPPCPYILIKIY